MATKGKLFALVGALALAGLSNGIWMRVEKDVPLDRAIQNMKEVVRREPRSAQAHYVLGRLYSLGFATRKEMQPLIRQPEGKLYEFPGWASVLVRRDPEFKTLTKADRVYLAGSIVEYRKAVELDPKNGLYALGLGWMYESATPYASQIGELNGKRASLKGIEDSALDAYRRAFRLTYQPELAGGHAGPHADSQISLEAATGILRILETRAKSEAVKHEVQAMRDASAKLARIPRAVTPIIVPLFGDASLGDLLGRNKVRFDLAGDGVEREWPWVGPTTGILCWDPLGTGKITSGSQLFGSSTWWMFFRHGYEALATLDDDADGRLRGSELNGICLWVDANGNAKSDAGEVRPLTFWQVTELSTNVTGTIGASPFSYGGLRRADGSTATTYDWTPTSLTGALNPALGTSLY